MNQLYKPVTLESMDGNDQDKIVLEGPIEFLNIVSPIGEKDRPVDHIDVMVRVHANEDGEILMLGVGIFIEPANLPEEKQA